MVVHPVNLHVFALVWCLCVLGVGAVLKQSHSSDHLVGATPTDEKADYDSFLREVGFDDERKAEPIELRTLRQKLFAQRQKEVLALNARPGKTWTASINLFSDHTDDELRSLLGHRLTAHRQGLVAAPGFLGVHSSVRRGVSQVHELPAHVDWRETLTSVRGAKSQGNCGSCWAVAASGSLDAHLEIRSGNFTPVAHEHLVRCVPNPRKCGGTGGCGGATAELAFDYVTAKGVPVYDTGDCGGPHGAARVMTEGFVQLPVNREFPLLEALAAHGPVVVAADASAWYPYSFGIFDRCDRDAEVNHAVLAVGFGVDDATRKKFYLIRNSWGASWGERGYIRLLRFDHERDHCGVDKNPREGVACEGGPDEMEVCGMCGVLSDSSYPVGPSLVFAGALGEPMLPSSGRSASEQRHERS